MNTDASRTEELRARIGELRESLQTLEAELEAETQKEQHEQIDRIDEYFNAVETRFSSLREFWKVVSEELRKSLGLK